MEEFLREYYTFLIKSVVIIAAITAIIVYRKYKKTVVKYFLWFLIYIFFVEFIGGYTVYVANYPSLIELKKALEGTLIEKNRWWYNIFWTIGSAVFYSSYFIKLIKTKLYKRILIWSRALFVLTAVIYIVFNIDELFSGRIGINTFLGAIIILLSTIMYFIEILQTEKILNFYKSVNFYIASVVFIWFLTRTPIWFYDVYFSTADWNYIILKAFLILLLNVFMYLTFTFALLWCKPQNN